MKPLIVAAGLTVAACQSAPTAVTVYPAKEISLPSECTSADAPWHQLPDADVKLSEAARHERINKDRYSDILAKRRICRTAVKAMGGE